MTILIALQDKSVSFHFAKNLDLDELDFFELISVVCRHHRGAGGVLKSHFQNSPKRKLIIFFAWNFEAFCDILLLLRKNISFQNDLTLYQTDLKKNLICFHNSKYATSEALRLHVFVSSSLLWHLFLKVECRVLQLHPSLLGQSWKKLNKTERNLTCKMSKTTTRSTFYMAIIIKNKKISIVNTA